MSDSSAKDTNGKQDFFLESEIKDSDIESLAHRYAMRGDLSRIQELCRNEGIDVLQQKDPQYRNFPAHCAARGGQPEVLFLLERLGAAKTLSQPNDRGQVPAHMAVAAGSADCIDALAKAGATSSLGMQDNSGQSPAHYVLRLLDGESDQRRLLEALVQHGGNEALTQRDKAGLTPVQIAADRKCWKTVVYFCDVLGAPTALEDILLQVARSVVRIGAPLATVLFKAGGKGIFEKRFADLLSAECRNESKDMRDSESTVLTMVVEENAPRIMRAIHDLAGPDPFLARNADGNTIAHLAAKKGRVECLERLGNILPGLFSVPNSKKQLPSHIAATAGQIACLDIIARFAEETLTAADKQGKEPIQLAISFDQPDSVDFFLRRVIQGERGKQRFQQVFFDLLLSSIDCDSIKCLESFLKFEGIQDIVNSRCDDVLQYAHGALTRKNFKALDILCKYFGCDMFTEVSKDNDSLLVHAARMGLYETLIPMIKKLGEKSKEAMLMRLKHGTCAALYVTADGQDNIMDYVFDSEWRSSEFMHRLTDDRGQTPMHHACRCGEIRGIRRIFQVLGSDVFSVCDTAGRLPIHHASDARTVQTVYELIGEECLKMGDKDGCTVAHHAVNHDDLDTVRFLIQVAGPQIFLHIPSGCRCSPVAVAVQNENERILRELFLLLGRDMFARPCSRAGNFLETAVEFGVLDKIGGLLAELMKSDTQEWHMAAAAAGGNPLGRGQIFDQGVAHHKRGDVTAVENDALDIGQTSYIRGAAEQGHSDTVLVEHTLESIQMEGKQDQQVSMCVYVCTHMHTRTYLHIVYIRTCVCTYQTE
jgi:ankyrin repeat protein